MGLDIALNAALSGLKASQEALGVISGNITNVNTENYARRVVTQASNVVNGIGQGVRIDGIERNVDEFVSEAMRMQKSIVGYSETVEDYYQRVTDLFGKPGASDNLSTRLNEFYSSVKTLADNPELASLKLNAVKSADLLANKISEIANKMHEYRFKADKEIEESTRQVNEYLSRLYSINTAIMKTSKSSGSLANLTEERDVLLQKLAEHINFESFFRANGQVVINTASGIALLDDNFYQLRYTSSSTVDKLINNGYINSLSVVNVDPRTNVDGFAEELVTSAKSADVETKLKSGKIKALIDLRDNFIGKVIEEVDLLATKLRDEANKVHNNGAAIPASGLLKSTNPLLSTSELYFQGKWRLGLVDDDGKPVTFPNGSELNPLTIDFSTLKGRSPNGIPMVSDVIKEINDYFYYTPTLPKTALGNLQDLRLVANSNFSTTPNGIVTFDLEVDNNSNSKARVEVLGVAVNNGATGLTSALPGFSDVAAGENRKTGQPLTISFAAGTGGPYNVDIQVRVTDDNNNVYNSVVRFSVSDTPASTTVLNDRYIASSVVSGDAVIKAPLTTQKFLEASFVDENESAVSTGYVGYLKLEALKQGYHIVIDEMDSYEKGDFNYTSNTVSSRGPSGFGFSHFMGLNDLFVNSNHNFKDDKAGLSFKVRQDILDNPNFVSTGKLVQMSPYTESRVIGDQKATATMRFLGNPSIGDTININGTTFTFVAAAGANNQITIGGSLPATLINITTVLSSLNSTTAATADKANYISNGIDTVNLEFKSAGTNGNSFSLAANMATTGVSLNGNVASYTPTDSLIGGTDKVANVKIQPNSYEVTIGNNASAYEMSQVFSKSFNFKASGNLPSLSGSLSTYTGNVISNTSVLTTYAVETKSKDQLIFDGFRNKFESGSGVNEKEELALVILYQNSFNAAAKVIQVTKELFQVLFDSL